MNDKVILGLGAGTPPPNIDIPTGGGIKHSEPIKIVDYTVDAESASAASFSFTVEAYPAIAECNHFSFIVKKKVNGSLPWVQVAVNNSRIGKNGPASHGMFMGEIVLKDGYANGYLSSFTNTSGYTNAITSSAVTRFGYGTIIPRYIGEIESIRFVSHTTFLDEGATIEIWGWNS